MPNVEHPDIAAMLKDGKLKTVHIFGNDAFGNEVFVGEEILVCKGEFFMKGLLSNDHMEILEILKSKEIRAGVENVELNSKREEFLEGMRDAENDRYDQIEEDERREIDESDIKNS